MLTSWWMPLRVGRYRPWPRTSNRVQETGRCHSMGTLPQTTQASRSRAMRRPRASTRVTRSRSMSRSIPQTYTMEVDRMGWYQGLGGRLLQHLGPLNGVQQPDCPIDSVTGLTKRPWTASYTLTVPTTWTG